VCTQLRRLNHLQLGLQLSWLHHYHLHDGSNVGKRLNDGHVHRAPREVAVQLEQLAICTVGPHVHHVVLQVGQGGGQGAVACTTGEEEWCMYKKGPTLVGWGVSSVQADHHLLEM
jgi:hypothetical protein